jgi:hypothetical protein
MTKKLLALLFVGLFLFAACGGDDKTNEPEGGGVQRGECPEAEAVGEVGKLPEGFPVPDGVTLTTSTEAGPSTIIAGYFATDLEEAFPAYRDAFTEAGWDVIKDEQEENDAEVFFEHGDVNGQVNMFGECEGRTKLRITVRPG